ncbi:MAG: hypothetical protein ACLFPQ_05175 [Candidatus Woesearchaeota archaeon]
MSKNDKIFEIVKYKGPMLPVQIVKEMGGSSQTNTFFVGAMLSELVTAGRLRLSHVKVGGSPLYYAPGQEEKLQDYSKYLHEKERRVYEKLKSEKILRDKILTPVERVCLRNIRDFAKPLEVSLKEKELFWKWYLFSNRDAEPIIKDMLKEDIGRSRQEEQKKEANQFSENRQPEASRNDVGTPTARELAERNGSNQDSSSYQEKKQDPEEKDLSAKKIDENKKEEFIGESSSQKSGSSEDRKDDKDEKKDRSEKEKKEEKQSFLEYEDNNDDPFVKEVKKFFLEHNITIVETNVIKKDSESEFLIKVPSAIGKLNYFCVARNKKKCSDSDLSLAYVKSQKKNLPVLFLCPGELSKKGQEVLDTELKTVTFKNI